MADLEHSEQFGVAEAVTSWTYNWKGGEAPHITPETTVRMDRHGDLHKQGSCLLCDGGILEIEMQQIAE